MTSFVEQGIGEFIILLAEEVALFGEIKKVNIWGSGTKFPPPVQEVMRSNLGIGRQFSVSGRFLVTSYSFDVRTLNVKNS